MIFLGLHYHTKYGEPSWDFGWCSNQLDIDLEFYEFIEEGWSPDIVRKQMFIAWSEKSRHFCPFTWIQLQYKGVVYGKD